VHCDRALATGSAAAAALQACDEHIKAARQVSHWTTLSGMQVHTLACYAKPTTAVHGCWAYLCYGITLAGQALDALCWFVLSNFFDKQSSS
jgi:hypothetical protein